MGHNKSLKEKVVTHFHELKKIKSSALCTALLKLLWGKENLSHLKGILIIKYKHTFNIEITSLNDYCLHINTEPQKRFSIQVT